MSSNRNCCYTRSSGSPMNSGMNRPVPSMNTGMNRSSGMPAMENRHSCREYHREKEFPIAMAYVPWQKFQKIYDPAKALCQGTIFAELDLPFCGKRGGR